MGHRNERDNIKGLGIHTIFDSKEIGLINWAGRESTRKKHCDYRSGNGSGYFGDVYQHTSVHQKQDFIPKTLDRMLSSPLKLEDLKYAQA